MQMPEPSWYTYSLRSNTEARAFEHQVSVMLPWRRFNRDVSPRVVSGSPSVVFLGEETRFGHELSISRVGSNAQPSGEMAGEMLGELAELWVQMTVLVTGAVRDAKGEPGA